jgi:hypothetical protein
MLKRKGRSGTDYTQKSYLRMDFSSQNRKIKTNMQ